MDIKIKKLLPNATVVFPVYIGQPAIIHNGDKDIVTSGVVSVPVCTTKFTVIETMNSIYKVGEKP